jgi:hypothetical protein
LGVAAISYDTPAILRGFASRHGIEFPLLADPRSILIRRFRVLDPDNSPNNVPPYGKPNMASAGFVVTDAAGLVREKFFGDVYTDRYTANNLLAALFPDWLARLPGREVRAPHLEVQLRQSDSAVVPGSRTTLVLDIQLPPGVHLYAPGAMGYKALELSLRPGQRVTPERAVFPPADTLMLEVIRERVPVYSGHVRVRQDVTISGDWRWVLSLGPDRGRGVSLRVAGTLKYQACDATLCYPPAQLPLSWDLRVHAMDLQRSNDSLESLPR